MSDFGVLAEPAPTRSPAQATERDTPQHCESDRSAQEVAARNLRGRTVRGAFVSTVAQVTTVVLRTGAIVLLSRLLVPRDFGLVAMATTLTGFLSLFRDFGLSTASVQRADITEDQISGLFWINLVAGGCLAAVCVAAAPAVARFYGEPRLFLITVALAAGFIFNGATAQHRAVLQRQMRFNALAVIDTVSWVVAILTSVVMAVAGFGYWAVVAMAISPLAVGVVGVWIAAGWVPGRPRRDSGLRPLLRYGGTLTLNTLVVYVAFNADKILLGRYWGVEALGLYSRAYQLITLPIDTLSSAVSQVALPALARVQDDPPRRSRYFLQGYGVFLMLVVPLTMACALFAEDIVRVFLGTKWTGSAAIFRLLTPTMFVLALINPLSWLLLATGRTGRSLRIALLIAPIAIVGYSIGLPAGPQGVAIGFSGAMLLLAAPVVLWAKHGLGLTARDIAGEVMPLLLASAVGGGLAVAGAHYMQSFPAVLRLAAESAILFGVFAALLPFLVKDKTMYLKLLGDANLLPAFLRPTP